MLLAFINDPIKTTFIYMLGALFILCLYLLIKTILAFCPVYICFTDSDVHIGKEPSCIELCFAFGSGTSLAYFLIIVIFVFILGNFNDFQAVHNLTLPIIVVLVPLLVFKPLYRNFVKPSEQNNATNKSNGGTNLKCKPSKKRTINETEL